MGRVSRVTWGCAMPRTLLPPPLWRVQRWLKHPLSARKSGIGKSSSLKGSDALLSSVLVAIKIEEVAWGLGPLLPPTYSELKKSPPENYLLGAAGEVSYESKESQVRNVNPFFNGEKFPGSILFDSRIEKAGVQRWLTFSAVWLCWSQVPLIFLLHLCRAQPPAHHATTTAPYAAKVGRISSEFAVPTDFSSILCRYFTETLKKHNKKTPPLKSPPRSRAPPPHHRSRSSSCLGPGAVDVPREESQPLRNQEQLLALLNSIPLDFFASTPHPGVLTNVIFKVYSSFLLAAVGALVCCNLYIWPEAIPAIII